MGAVRLVCDGEMFTKRVEVGWELSYARNVPHIVGKLEVLGD